MKDLAIHKGLKVNTLVNLELKYEYVDGKPPRILEDDHYISTEAVIITSHEGVNNFVKCRSMIEKIDIYRFPDSNYSFSRIKEHIINIFKYKPISWWFKLYGSIKSI